MSENAIKRASSASERKVVITLKDHNAVGKVYTKLKAGLTPSEVLVEALKQVESGNVYADKECKQLIADDFIEVQTERRTKRVDEDDFVFLIDRQFAQKHIIGAKIIK